jgi:hypothetical protein
LPDQAALGFGVPMRQNAMEPAAMIDTKAGKY